MEIFENSTGYYHEELGRKKDNGEKIKIENMRAIFVKTKYKSRGRQEI